MKPAAGPLLMVWMLLGVLPAPSAVAGEVSWLAGAYVDSLNLVNVKAGVAFPEGDEIDPESHYYGSFRYGDVEVGLDGAKVSLGFGQYVGHGLDRIGLSYAHLDNGELGGFEAVVSQMAMSFKVGYYLGLAHSGDRFLLGVGMGF
jgi:hypothetical protein